MGRGTTALLGAACVALLLGACGTSSGDASDADPVSAATTQQSATEVPTADSRTSSPTSNPSSDTTTEPTEVTPTEPPIESPSPPEDEADGEPPFPDDTDLQLAENSGEWDLVLTDVRVGAHDGFDRIVLEFTGTGVPGWSVGYVDRARLDGSGETVELDGDASLDIYASGTTWPADGYDSGPQWLEPDGGDISDVYVGGTFEGYTQVLAGIDGSRAPFRVFALPDPPRLVVDVADSAG